MWKIVKNELKYSRQTIFALVLVMLVFLIVWIIAGRENPDNSYPALRMVFLNMMLILWITNIARQYKEKTIRIHQLLPLSGWKIGLTRLLTFPLVALNTLFVFALVILLAKPGFVQPVIVWDWLMLAGILLLVNVLPYLHRDLTRWFTGKLQKVLITLFYILILLCLSLMYYFFIHVLESTTANSWLQPFKQNFQYYATAPLVILFILFLSAGLMLLAMFTFHQRKNYLE